MFSLFNRKTRVEHLIAKDGMDHATNRFAEIVSRKLPTRELAYQFILEELDGASQGNAASKQFAEGSGIPLEEYEGALSNSNPEVDGPEGPQQLLMALSLDLAKNKALMAEFRCKVDDKIMRRYGFGKYSSAEAHAPTASGNKLIGPDTNDLRRKNYTIKPNGFTVEDAESGDVLAAVIRDEMFQGAVLMSNTGGQGPLAPWPLNSNPFADDNHFFGAGLSPQGRWSFSIRPSAPFSQILREAREQYARSCAGR